MSNPHTPPESAEPAEPAAPDDAPASPGAGADAAMARPPAASPADDATLILTTPVARGAAASPPPASTSPTQQRLAMALPPGHRLAGKFEVIDLIGAPGGFGIAYLCRDLQLGRTVVVKELFPAGMVMRAAGTAAVIVQRAEYERLFALQRELLLDEARRLAALDQVDAVVAVHDHFSENNTGYIVMHHVFGHPLTERLREAGRVDAAQLMRWIWPLLTGLEAVHDAGVLHRDIKPDNVLIDQRGRLVLIDLGNAVARRGSLAQERDVGSYFAVSPYYGAPEQYRNQAERMGPWTDLYSVGALMYVALSGQRPVDAQQRLAGVAMPDIATLVPDAPAELLAAVSACLALDERERPPDVKALLARLAPLQPAARHWLELLPASDRSRFGRRMRAMHALQTQGHGLPRHLSQLNVAAGLLQSFWFFGHRLPLAGAVSALATLAATLALLAGRDPWPSLAPVLALVWALGVLPCAWLADLLRFRRLDLVAKPLPLANEAQVAEARAQLAAQERPDLRQALLALLLPAALFGGTTLLHERQLAVQRSVAAAVELQGLRSAFQSVVQQQQRPPTADEVPPFTPNSEVQRVELRPGGLEVVLALPAVEGRRVRWRLDEQGRWRCESVDLPARFTPLACSGP